MADAEVTDVVDAAASDATAVEDVVKVPRQLLLMGICQRGVPYWLCLWAITN